MSTIASLTLPALPDFVGHIQERLFRDYGLAVEDWSGAATTLSRLEEKHFLDDPNPILLAEHKRALERLLRFGKWFQLSTAHPDFPEPKTAAIVEATMQQLRDKLAMWHGEALSAAAADQVLRECGLLA